jgi:hypothetical protein
MGTGLGGYAWSSPHLNGGDTGLKGFVVLALLIPRPSCGAFSCLRPITTL